MAKRCYLVVIWFPGFTHALYSICADNAVRFYLVTKQAVFIIFLVFMNFERRDILKAKLDFLEVDDPILFPSLQQKVLRTLTAKRHPLVSSASINLVFQAFRDELTKRGDQILFQIREVFANAYVEDIDNLAKGLREELIKRLESAAAIASSVFLSSTESIRSQIPPHNLPSRRAIAEHLEKQKPGLLAEVDLICAKLRDTQSPRLFLKKGDIFGGNRALRAIFESATKSIDIIDTYLGPKVFDLVEVSNGSVQIRLISDKVDDPTKQAFQDFKQQYGRIQFRLCDLKDIHARYIILDGRTALHIGHSLKDLGKSDSSIEGASSDILQRFEDLWLNARIVS